MVIILIKKDFFFSFSEKKTINVNRNIYKNELETIGFLGNSKFFSYQIYITCIYFCEIKINK